MNINLAERFERETGSSFYLTGSSTDRVYEYLSHLEYLIPGEKVLMVARAGEGNMNLTLRVTTTRRRFILKQSRSWVAKYPELAAPADRILIERNFYQAIVGNRFLAGHMPEIMKVDPDNFVLIMEDLGRVGDMSYVYNGERSIGREQLTSLLQFASQVHQIEPEDFPANEQLKALNHAHIFALPLRPDNGFPLDAIHPGLAAVARPLQHDERLRSVVEKLGKMYLKGGKRLIHGDYYPGSFLEMEKRIFVIDAEFAHAGLPEFDIGVLMAHLLMSRAPEKRILQIDRDYVQPPGFDTTLTRQFCYVEVIRRLIGIAQLPISLTLEERRGLLERARSGLV